MTNLSTTIALFTFFVTIIIFVICYQALPKKTENKRTKQKNNNIFLSRRIEYLITSFSSLAVTLISIIGAFYFTVLYDRDQDKEKLVGMLESAIHSTETTIETISWQFDIIDEKKRNQNANKYGDNINEENFTLYEPIPYYDILPKILEDGDLFTLLSDDSKYLLPEYMMNSTGIMEFYNTETNSYYNHLTLKHFRNNLEWQLNHLQNELKYLEDTNIGFENDSQKEKFYDVLNDWLYNDGEAYDNLSDDDKKLYWENPFIKGRISYGKEWLCIEEEWKQYTNYITQ